jgi:acetyl-CoA carboxylase biotin carboxyl carrier protein
VNLTDEDVEEILRLLDKSPYDELKLTTDRFSLELSTTTGHGSQPPAHKTPRTGSAEKQAVPAMTAGPAAGEIVDIRPPLPGTFYRAPSPGAEPFTEVGSTVAEDSILGLVETMKLMNSVVAGCSGEVVEICTTNGTLVDKDDVIMRIRVS